MTLTRTSMFSTCGFSLFIILLCLLPKTFNSTESFTKKPLLSDELQVRSSEKVLNCAEGRKGPSSISENEDIGSLSVKAKIEAGESDTSPTVGWSLATFKTDDLNAATSDVQNTEYVPTEDEKNTNVSVFQKVFNKVRKNEILLIVPVVIILIAVFLFQWMYNKREYFQQKFPCLRKREPEKKKKSHADFENITLVNSDCV